MTISIVIPFFNEEKNLEILIPQLIISLKKIRRQRFEIILVDDSSTDKSFFVAKNKSKNSKFLKFKLIRLSKRSGQTGAFKRAFKIAIGQYIIRMDADLQDDPNDIIKFIEKIHLNYDLVIGCRNKRRHSYLIIFFSNLYNLIMRLILSSKINTYSASFVAFKKFFLRDLPWYHNDHRYLPAIVIKRGALKVSEVILKHKKRKFGLSRYNTLSKIILGIPEVFLFILRLNLNFYSRR